MSDDQTTQSTKQPRQPQTDRTPIPIERLLFSMANPNGAQLPHGPTGENVQLTPMLKAGLNNNIRVEIEFLPWMRRYRVTRSMKKTHEEKGREVVTYEPMGEPFYVPESWAIHIEAKL